MSPFWNTFIVELKNCTRRIVRNLIEQKFKMTTYVVWLRETLKTNLKLNILFLIKFYKGIVNEKYSSRKFLAPINNKDVGEHPISISKFQMDGSFQKLK